MYRLKKVYNEWTGIPLLLEKDKGKGVEFL